MVMRLIGVCFALSVSVFASIDKGKLDALHIDAMVVKDLKTKSVLYSKEGRKTLKPASLTKVITVLLAIQSGKMDQRVTITPAMRNVEPTIAGYRNGEKILLKDLVKAAMIESDNDAAMAIAIAVGGNTKHFVEMMNAKARAIGMRHTHFTNPCGYDAKEHYSTPNDLLKMAEYAIKNQSFNRISRLNRHVYYSQNGNHRKFVAHTHNRLLAKYPYAVGIKTGYTSKAGACLIARAKKEGSDCMIVMMNAKEDRWKTAKHIFEQVLNS